MKKAITAVIALLSYTSCFAGNGNRGDTANFSLGKYGCTPNLDNSMVHARMASAALINKSCISIQYNNSYFLPQIGFSDINMHLAFEKLNMGIFFNHYGFSAYSEFSAGLSFSKFFSPWFAFNISGEYYGVYLSNDEGIINSGMAHISIVAFPIKGVSIGFHTYNISFSRLNTAYGKILIPSTFTLGLSYNFSNKTIISTEFGKELKGPIYYGVGLEYMPVKQFILRIGINGEDENISPSGGFALRFGIFGLDLGIRYHFRLGLSMAAGLKFSLKK